ncbi:MAG: hypothetical protein QOH79_1140 [Acidimicrobiaceae bacterium]
MTSRRSALVRVITRLNVGGPARQALLLTRELADEFPTTLVAGTPAPTEGALSDPAVRVTAASLVRPVRPAADLRSFRTVRHIIRSHETRILHTHMAKAGAVGRLAAKSLGRTRPRTVHTFHGHVLEGYFSPVVQRSFLAAERYLARSTDVLLAVSPEIRDELLALGIGRPSQYEVMPLGLELDPFLAVSGSTGRLRQALDLDRDVPLVGVVGRLVPIKSVDLMLEAMPLLPGVHLAVVGDGEERPALERLGRDRGIEDRVHFTGWFDDIPSAMSDLDVVALSSRNEGTPVALIEALAAGRPVVATRVGGVEHVVLPDQTGVLVPPSDPAALAIAISRLLGDQDLCDRLGAAGRKHVRANFSASRLVDDMRALYRELAR